MKKVLCLIEMLVNDETTDEHIETMLDDAAVQINEPNEELEADGVETSSLLTGWVMFGEGRSRFVNTTFDGTLVGFPLASTLEWGELADRIGDAMLGQPEIGCICGAPGEDPGIHRDCRSTGCDPSCTVCEDVKATVKDLRPSTPNEYDDHLFQDDGTEEHLCRWGGTIARCGATALSWNHRNDPTVKAYIVGPKEKLAPVVMPPTNVAGARCTLHPAFDSDYCPRCGTAAKI